MFKWNLAYAPNCECKDIKLHTINDIEKSGYNIISAEVPGNFELDFMREGLIEDLYFSDNTLKAQELENLHLWYFTTFETEDNLSYLHFNGIDTFADIYVNGKFVLSCDNMFLEYDVFDEIKPGVNELVIHIKPTCIEARKYTLPVGATAQAYNYESLYTRKAAHMFGWDIMPRIVSGGIWKDVEIRKQKAEKLNEVFLSTTNISDKTATLKLFVSADIQNDFIRDYSVKISGICNNHQFQEQKTLWHNTYQFCFSIENPLLWWPKNSGLPNLYDITIELIYKDTVIDSKNFKFGIRTVMLNYTDGTDNDGNGEFCFEINNKKIFVLGTNWVPLDAFHSNDKNRLQKALMLLDDIGCNMVRCWGGNVYESDEFFDFCDEHGIMVWQDFAMGCGVYPQEKEFYDKIEKEAVSQIKRLRNHSSLVLWAGDNECDLAIDWVPRVMNDPNNNYITRNILKYAVMSHDTSRPYLPSSPFVSEKAYKERLRLPEDHLWGPRDYFKGKFYTSSVCHFASETGYHGFPAVSSLKKFLKNPETIFTSDYIPTNEYLVHASSMETSADSPYAYRIKLAYNQVETLFGKAEENFEDFVMQSQISQAEAMKYFIERFRISKWRRTGIIWWNLLDGWPQVSDAVVDYYFTKKLAYHYIKRSQQPVCLMFDEPDNTAYDMYAVNEFPHSVTVEYTVTDVLKDKVLLKGKVTVPKESSIKTESLTIEGQNFLLIQWTMNSEVYTNHYFTNILDINYKEYITAIEKCGYNHNFGGLPI